MVEIVWSIYRNAQNPVRVNGTFLHDFPAQVGLHLGSMLSPLSFIIVLEKSRSGCPQELDYAGEFALVCETLEGLRGTD